MKWKIIISKDSQKFLNQNNINDDEVISYLKKAIRKLEGKEEKVDLSKMKGKWKDYFRLRLGRMRVILKINFERTEIWVDRIDFRGDVYK